MYNNSPSIKGFSAFFHWTPLLKIFETSCCLEWNSFNSYIDNLSKVWTINANIMMYKLYDWHIGMSLLTLSEKSVLGHLFYTVINFVLNLVVNNTIPSLQLGPLYPGRQPRQNPVLMLHLFSWHLLGHVKEHFSPKFPGSLQPN